MAGLWRCRLLSAVSSGLKKTSCAGSRLEFSQPPRSLIFFDGYLARAWAQQSSLGRMLDPIADKLIVAASLMMLVTDRTISGFSIWAAIVILSREILVSGLREFLAELRVSVPVSTIAKWKTTLQLVAVGFLIAGPAGERVLPGTTAIGIVMLWVAALLTLYTGYDYFRAGIRHVVEADD